MLTKSKLRTSVLLVIGILILLNFLANRFYFRGDFTEDQRYSLSEATENIIENLQDPVTVTAYFSQNLPPDIEQVRNDFRDILTEYNRRSDGNVVYEFVDPSENQQTEQEAMMAGIRPIMINVREKDQVSQQKAYLGAVLQYGENKEVIPFIQPGAAMEYALSSGIKKIASDDKPFVGILQGQGEPSPQEMPQLMEQLSVMYQAGPVTLSDTMGVPPEYSTLAIIAPKDSIKEEYIHYLDEFLARGGRMIIALNQVDGKLQESRGVVQTTRFGKWLAEKGIEIGTEFVLDANAASISVRQQQGPFVMNTPVQFPYLPIVTNFADHPVTTGLEAVVFPFVSPVRYAGADTTVKFTPLVFTSENAALNSPPVYFNVSKKWQRSDFPEKDIVVAAAIEGDIDGNPNSRMVVFGDGDFVVNGSGQQQQRLSEDNISLMANAIDWLSDDTGLIALRTKGVTARPIDPSIEEGVKAAFKYTNFLLPILLIIIYGLTRMQIRRKKRKNLKSVDYVI